MQNFFSRKFAIFFLYSFLGVFFSLFFSYSVFAGVWDNSGGKHISSPTLTVVPNEVVTFGAGVYTGTILSLGGFSGEYSPAIGTSSKNFNVSSASGLTNYNHYIKSANSSQKIRLKKISSRTGYFNTGEKVGKLGCKTDSNSNAAVSYFCFHAQVEAVCTAPSGGDVFQGESYTENLAHGSVVKTCQSDWTFSEAAAVCTDGYTGSLCQTAPVPTCSSAEHLEDNVCVSNQQACEKANGIGKQYWNSETLDWDPSCSVDSCNDGYYKNPTNLTQCFEIIDGMCSSTKNTCEAGDYKNETNLATVFKWSCEGKNSGENESCSLSCASGEHIENDSCVSNSATCTVTNGSGRKSWNGSWGSCVPNTCNDGYFLSDGACQVVINDCAANTREGYLFTAFNHDTTQPVSKRDDLGNGDVRSYFATASCSDGEVSIAGESSQLECGEGREEKISGKCSPVVTYSWDEPNFPAFPADACGNTTVERTVSCKGADNGNYADSFCAGQTKPAESKTEDKGDEVCGWSEFSEFSAIAACDKGNGKQEYIKSRTCSLVTDLESANHCQGEAAVTEFREECKKCELDGVSIIHGSAQNFWNYETIQYGSSDECFVSARKCNNGELEGLSDYRYKSQCVIVDTIDIDIAVLDRKNFSERQVIAPNGEIDTDFEIIVSNDSIENSSYLAQKEVKFSVEWDSEIFSLPNIDDFDGTRDDPKANDTSDNFECYTEGVSGVENTKITCSATTHTSLDDGLTTAGILGEFDFQNIPGKFGDSDIVFKTWTTNQDVVDAGGDIAGDVSGNNIFMINTAVSPYCLVKKSSASDIANGEFDHVLYGNLDSGTHKIANGSDDISNNVQNSVISQLGSDGSWQLYLNEDDTTLENEKSSNPDSSKNSDPENTEYFVFPGKTRYAVEEISGGYNIYELSCVGDPSNSGKYKISGNIDSSSKKIPETGICVESNGEIDDDKTWIAGTCSEKVTDLSIEVVNSHNQPLTENIQLKMGASVHSSLRANVMNNGPDTAKNVTLKVEYNSDYLDLETEGLTGWEFKSSTDDSAVYELDNSSFEADYSSIPSFVFVPQKIGNSEVIFTVSSDTDDGNDENNRAIIAVENIGTEIYFQSPTDTTTPKEKDFPENSESDYIGTFQAASGNTFQFCNGSSTTDDGKFSISGYNLNQVSKFDYEAGEKYELCVEVGEQTYSSSWWSASTVSFTPYGTSDLVVNITNVNEKPLSNASGLDGIVTPWGDAISISRELLEIGDAFENIDPDAGDENKSLTITGISSAQNGNYAVEVSDTNHKGTLKLNSGVLEFSSVATGVTQSFWYKICDDEGLCGVRKFSLDVSSTGASCSGVFGDETATGSVASGESLTELSQKTSPQLVCSGTSSISCNNGEFSNDPTNFIEMSYCTVEKQAGAVFEKNIDTFKTNGAENGEENRKEFFLGETVTFTPTLPEKTAITGEFSGMLSLTFNSSLFEKISGEGWTCHTAGYNKFCTQEVLYKGAEISFPLSLKVIGNPEKISETDVFYNAEEFSVLENSLKTISLKISPRGLLVQDFSGIENRINAHTTGSLQVAEINSQSDIEFSLESDTAKCSGEFDNSYFSITENKQMALTQIFDEGTKSACIKISQNVDGETPLVLGYDTVTVAVVTGDFLIFLPESNFEETIPENYTGLIGVVSGKGLRGLTLKDGSTQNDHFKIQEKNTAPANKILSQLSVLSVATISALKEDTNNSGEISGTLMRNFLGAASSDTNVLLTTAKKDFIEDFPPRTAAQKYYEVYLVKGFDYEDTDIADHTPILELTGEFADNTGLTDTFYFPIEDVNEAPDAVHITQGEGLENGGERVLNFEGLEIDDATDEDSTDNADNLVIVGISLIEKTSIVSTDWDDTKLEESEQYEFEIQDSGTRILVKNLGATGSKTLYFLLCDDDTSAPKCSVSSVTGSFSPPLSCEPVSFDEGTLKYSFPENINIDNAAATVVSGSAISGQKFYESTNAQSCAALEKEVQCFNGKYVLGDNTEIVEDLYSQCFNQCEPFDTDQQPWKNSGETDSFYRDENTVLCDDEANKKTLQCSDGVWMSKSDESSLTFDIEVLYPERSCVAQCKNFDYDAETNPTALTHTGEEISVFVEKTIDVGASNSCSDASVQKTLMCDEGVWKNSGNTYAWETDKWVSSEASSLPLYNTCSQNNSCTFSWKTRSEGTESMQLENGKTLGSLVFPAGTMLYSEKTDCSDSLVYTSHVICDNGNVLYGKTNASRAIRTTSFYGYCNAKCTLSGSEYESGNQLNVYKKVGGTCQKKSLTCQESGVWENNLTGNDFRELGYSTEENCGDDGTGYEDGNNEIYDEITEVIDEINEAQENDEVEIDGEITIFKEVNTPLVNTHSALESSPITAQIPEKYNVTKGNATARRLFESPFQTTNASGLDVTLKVRADYADDEQDFALEGTTEELKSQIAVRWKVSGKDKNGEPISLVPVFDYDVENTNDSAYGCGTGESKSMLCLHHFNDPAEINIVNDGTHSYAVLEIRNAGFVGKISSNSSDPDIQFAVSEYNDAENSDDGVVSLYSFLESSDLGVTYPEFQAVYEHPVGTEKNASNLSYQFIIDGVTNADAALSDNRFKVTSSGSYGGAQQKIETTVEKGTLLPVFNYVIFGE